MSDFFFVLFFRTSGARRIGVGAFRFPPTGVASAFPRVSALMPLCGRIGRVFLFFSRERFVFFLLFSRRLPFLLLLQL